MQIVCSPECNAGGSNDVMEKNQAGTCQTPVRCVVGVIEEVQDPVGERQC